MSDRKHKAGTEQRENQKMRLNKYLASCGICSRREADKLIEMGCVVVNGLVASLGQMVELSDHIVVNGKVLDGKRRKVVLAYYKPIGVTCTEKDVHAKKKILDMIDYPERVTYAGRLDKDSEGLILLTNDGELIHAMMQGANCHEKEYVVKVNKEITASFVQKMSQGIYIKELNTSTRKCEVTQLGKYTFCIILTQGLNRQIRRMCGSLGYGVQSLKRIRVMNINLNDLKYGTYREVTGAELEELYREAGM